jgi:uncharacterized membrane protein YdjX (TVP38/TMEM64 family)
MTRIAAAMQAWMMRIIQQHGFMGILLLASWPNAAFDLCGICCGAFLMPFWQFFGATLIGKGVIKVSGQAMFFVALFRWVNFVVFGGLFVGSRCWHCCVCWCLLVGVVVRHPLLLSCNGCMRATLMLLSESAVPCCRCCCPADKPAVLPS